jgi:hypothetical protein
LVHGILQRVPTIAIPLQWVGEIMAMSCAVVISSVNCEKSGRKEMNK